MPSVYGRGGGLYAKPKAVKWLFLSHKTVERFVSVKWKGNLCETVKWKIQPPSPPLRAPLQNAYYFFTN